MQLPTNKTFDLKRRNPSGVLSVVLTDLPALCVPMDDQLAAMQGAPANRTFAITFQGTPDVREQDVLVSQVDATDAFRVRGTKKYLTLHLAHTYAVAEGLWGTA